MKIYAITIKIYKNLKQKNTSYNQILKIKIKNYLNKRKIVLVCIRKAYNKY